MTDYGSTVEMGGLYYRGRKFSEDEVKKHGKEWDILCSGDEESIKRTNERLNPNSLIVHDHYWKTNGKWYVQIKVGKDHIIGDDDFRKVVREENERKHLMLSEKEIREEAHRRALKAYRNSGYGGRNRGVELDTYTGKLLDKIAEDYESRASSSCFIATAVYGSSEHPDLETFRKFRNQILLTRPAGKLLVKFYYSFSPFIVNIISSNPSLKNMFRAFLNKLANSIRNRKLLSNR